MHTPVEHGTTLKRTDGTEKMTEEVLEEATAVEVDKDGNLIRIIYPV
jgi:hypothetical protein